MYKTIKGISRALAIAAVQNEALETRRKWISKEAFCEEEKTMAEKIAAVVADVLSNADGRRWCGAFWQDHDNVLDDLTAACRGLFIGMRTQDEIRETLKHCGINTLLIPFDHSSVPWHKSEGDPVQA